MKKTLSTLALVAGAVVASAPATAAITLGFTSDKASIATGETVLVTASISGLGAEVLSGFDLNFLYNPSVLELALASYFGAPLGNQTVLNQQFIPGNLGFDVVSLDDDATLAANQPDAFTLFQFAMVGGADGTTLFTLGSDPDFERAFIGLSSNALTVNVGSLCIAVGTGSCGGTIPEPSTYGLAGIALLGALLPGALRRRRKG